jgi:hypothetical protein
MHETRRSAPRVKLPPQVQTIDCVHGEYAQMLPSAERDRRAIVVLALPEDVARVSVAAALGPYIGKWGRRTGDISVLLDLSNHPTTAAQTIIVDRVQMWPDMADGLPEALNRAGILLVLGLEQMLQETPHRLAAFLEARARNQVVVIVTALSDELSAVAAKTGPVFVDYSIKRGADLDEVAAKVSAAAVEAAKQATRRVKRAGGLM